MDSNKKTIGFNYNYMNSMHIRWIQLKSVSFHAKQFEFNLNQIASMEIKRMQQQ